MSFQRLNNCYNFILAIVLLCLFMFFLSQELEAKDCSSGGSGGIEHSRPAREILILTQYLQKYMPEARASYLAEIYYDAGEEFAVNPVVLVAIGKAESGYFSHARSSVGARGIQQIMPLWVKHIPFLNSADDLYKPELNIRASAYIMSHYLDRCGGLEQAILCYHGGPLALRQPKAETVTYQQDVFNYIKKVERI